MYSPCGNLWLKVVFLFLLMVALNNSFAICDERCSAIIGQLLTLSDAIATLTYRGVQTFAVSRPAQPGCAIASFPSPSDECNLTGRKSVSPSCDRADGYKCP